MRRHQRMVQAEGEGERVTYLLGALSCKLVNAAKLFRTVRRLAKTYDKKRIL